MQRDRQVRQVCVFFYLCQDISSSQLLDVTSSQVWKSRCVRSVAAQEEGVAGGSSQAVAQAADSRSMFHRTALAHVTLKETDR